LVERQQFDPTLLDPLLGIYLGILRLHPIEKEVKVLELLLIRMV